MRPTDFSYYLTGFLSKYLPNELGASPNTIASYTDTFILFLTYMRDEQKIPVEQMMLKNITKNFVISYLEWIETTRHCCVQTRNVRLAAIHSFFKYLQYENPDNLNEWQRILSIPVKKGEKGTLNYMTLDGIKLLLEMPDVNTASGRRDLAMISLMYDTAARVQEIIDLTPSMVRLEKPYTIKLIGKGNKARIVPLMDSDVMILKQYMEEKQLSSPNANFYPLFYNKRHEKLTRAGVGYILDKYVKMARKVNPSLIPDKFTCHCMRHSKSMHMLQAGVNLVYIRDILGHNSIQTTEIYARADSKQKREAIENAYTDILPKEQPQWLDNSDLLSWLKSFR